MRDIWLVLLSTSADAQAVD